MHFASVKESCFAGSFCTLAGYQHQGTGKTAESGSLVLQVPSAPVYERALALRQQTKESISERMASKGQRYSKITG